MIRYRWAQAIVLGLLALIVIGAGTACSTSTGESAIASSSPTHTPSPISSPDAQLSPDEVSENTPTPEPVSGDEMTGAPTEEDTATLTEDNTAQVSNFQTFQIVPEKSEARFIIREELFGNPKTVIGRTREISGAVSVDLAGLQEIQVTPVWVDARDLKTNDSFRNRTLRRQILLSAQDEYQYVVFEPTDFEDLPAATVVSIGEPFSFSVTGDLTIRGITQPVTFTMVATATSQTELSASGTTTVLRSDYELGIPSVPGVANVSEEVRLTVDILAVASE